MRIYEDRVFFQGLPIFANIAKFGLTYMDDTTLYIAEN